DRPFAVDRQVIDAKVEVGKGGEERSVISAGRFDATLSSKTRVAELGVVRALTGPNGEVALIECMGERGRERRGVDGLHVRLSSKRCRCDERREDRSGVHWAL